MMKIIEMVKDTFDSFRMKRPVALVPVCADGKKATLNLLESSKLEKEEKQARAMVALQSNESSNEDVPTVGNENAATQNEDAHAANYNDAEQHDKHNQNESERNPKHLFIRPNSYEMQTAKGFWPFFIMVVALLSQDMHFYETVTSEADFGMGRGNKLT